MSANRSVQSAQRRRAGPPEPQAPGRGGPQPSINSAQMFANQARAGPGPNLPPGRLAAQQMNMQQMNMQQEQMYNQGPPNVGVASINKMTIPQAITLVTLRLGALETKMMNLEAHLPQILAGGDNINGMDFAENGIIQSLMERVDNIEKSLENGDNNQTDNAIASINPTELIAIKNQLETIKQSIIQFKGISATLANDNKGLKAQIEKLRQELGEYKQLLNMLQTTSLENSQKILEFELSFVPNNGIPLDQLEEDLEDLEEVDGEIQATFSLSNTNNDANLSQQELLGVNLKEAIELELNS
jgi:hypothetical protein